MFSSDMINGVGALLIFMGLLLAIAVLRLIAKSRKLRETLQTQDRVSRQLSAAHEIAGVGSWDQDLASGNII